MKLIDFVKAAGAAIAVLGLKYVLMFILFFIGSLVIEVYIIVMMRGQKILSQREFYNAAALHIEPWCYHIAGAVGLFGAGYLFARRNPQRNPYLFAAAILVLFAFMDIATMGFVGLFETAFNVSMLAKLLGALGGAFLATRKKVVPTELVSAQR